MTAGSLAVKNKSTGAGSAYYEAAARIRTQTHDLAQVLVGIRLRPHQRTSRAVEFFNSISESGHVRRAPDAGDRAHAVALQRSVFHSHARETHFVRRW